MSSALATRFSRNRVSVTSDQPLSDDQIYRVAPSIFAPAAHDSRSARYTYIPTIDVLAGLRREGFLPFMAGQSKCRIEGKSDFTKHMLRLRHAGSIAKSEANEVILINSHDGTSSYQMLAGCFRFVCMNGLVTGTIEQDLRIRHGGDVMGRVIEGAYEIVNQFDRIDGQRDGMKALTLDRDEERVFATAALALKYDPEEGTPPVSPEQVLRPRRSADVDLSLWTTFNRVQENMIRGGLHGHTAAGRRTTTREVQGIDQNVKINRGLWILAEGMRRLKDAA